jgi:Rad3-related DNA helicase
MSKNNIVNLFPSKYTPRQAQIQVLNNIQKTLESSKKFIIACLPTGIGKSHIAYTIGNTSQEIDEHKKNDIINYEVYKKNRNGEFTFDTKYEKLKKQGSFIFTITRNLQDQYQNIFDDIESVKGKNNYQCAVDTNQTADFAPCLYTKNLKESCFEKRQCSYFETRNRGLASKISVFNYRSFFNLRDFLQERDIYICDEADGLEEELVSQFTLEINYNFLSSENINFEKIISDDSEQAYIWLIDVHSQIKSNLNEIKQKASLVSQKKGFDALHFKQLQQINKLTRLEGLMENAIEYWHTCQYMVEDKKADKVIFTPYDIKPLAQNMFNKANKIILMSATLSNHEEFAKSLGISKNDYDYIEVDSPFKADKSPIFCTTKFNLSYSNNNNDLNKIIDATLELCQKHKDQKGIIHTHSNFITEAFRKKINKNSRFLFRQPGISNEDILEEHKNSTFPTVLISPSLDTGVSLDGDLGRFQVIVKAPFLPLGSKRIKRKMDSNPEHYKMKMLNNLVQMAGRCTRSEQDYSVTYILDGVATKAITSNRNKLPKHFLNRIH